MIGESLLARYRAAGQTPRVILLVLIVAAGAYGLYVQTHLQQIHEFNNRELGHGAKVVKEVVDGIVSTAENWKKSDEEIARPSGGGAGTEDRRMSAYRLCHEFVDRQPYLVHNKTVCE